VAKNIVNDEGGFHNRITHAIHLRPFTLEETKAFLAKKRIRWTDNAIAEIYMIFGGIPLYLEQINMGESPATVVNRLCFTQGGLLTNEYQNLYKALFDQPENHEAVIKSLANAAEGLSRADIVR
jgi:uncharacterized protein